MRVLGADAPTIKAGELEFPIVIKLPQAEQDKLDTVKKQAPLLERVYKGFAKGAGAMFATGAVLSGVAFLFSGQGFRQTFGVLWDILGMLSDMLFLFLYPDVIEPLLKGMVEAANLIAQGPEMWGEAAKVLFDAMWDSATGLIDLMVRVFTDPRMIEAFIEVGKAISDGMERGFGEPARRIVEGRGENAAERATTDIFFGPWPELFRRWGWDWGYNDD